MKALRSRYVLAHPARRPLRIFASDPMEGRTAASRVTIDVPNEVPLAPGPQGARLEVIDYDGSHDRFYPPVDLNAPAILMQRGLEPTESDPRFHQQMVYAVAMKTLENFDRALGRRLEFRRSRSKRLRILPHAFHGANAYYSSKLNALLFGYFRSSRKDPGSTLPGQNVFTCLSHDVIAHEMTHALVDRLRRYFLEPSNRDVLAFHEGFADIVALFQHFSFQELLRDHVQRTRSDLRKPGGLVELAQEFGHATGMNRALRSALDKPNEKLYDRVIEPHRRGSILVAAVFEAFFATYQRRIRDLIRIATGGTGNLPDGDLHPDLLNRIAGEATQTAQSVLSMCIRAFDYLPPVDIRFGDYLRAMITADYELQPTDPFGLRQSMIEAFRARSIYPDRVASLAEESLLWEAPGDPLRIPLDPELLQGLAFAASSFSRGALDPETESVEQGHSVTPEGTDIDVSDTVAHELRTFASRNAEALMLDASPGRSIEVHGFHSVFRVAADGQLLIELVVQFAQRQDDESLGGIPFRGGTTVVAAADGRVRYLIAKPLPSAVPGDAQRQAEATERLEHQRQYLDLCDRADPLFALSDAAYARDRAVRRMDLAGLHAGGGL